VVRVLYQRSGRSLNNSEMTVADHPILLPLGSDGQALVEILGERWLQNRRWPVFDYLNRRLLRTVGADATETMSRLPVVQGHSIEVYRLIFTERGGPFAELDQRVGLTIAGLYRLPQARDPLSQIVAVVRYLAEADAALEPDPDHPVSLDLPIVDLLTTHLRDELKGWSPEVLMAALEHEPPLWGTVQHGPDHIGVRAGRLSLFRGVADADDYLRRVIRLLGAHAPRAAAPAVLSPLDLPEALGYLEAVWRVRFGTFLLGRTQPASLARLALPCASSDEFDARLSALADVLGHLEVDLPPEAEAEAKRAGERSLARLRRRLEGQLEGAALDRAVSAIRTLQDVVRIRVGAQHSGLAGETAETFRQLGLPYPPSDPAAAWESIRGVTATAVDAIRQELQAAESPS
jgi:hypothetical protein